MTLLASPPTVGGRALPDAAGGRATSAGSALGALLAEVGETLGRVPSGDLGVSSSEVAALVAECGRLASRVESLKLRLVASGAAARAASESGHSSTGSWLAGQTRATPSSAASEARLAERLVGGPGDRASRAAGARALTPTGKALAAGEISPAHAQVVTDALRHLPDSWAEADRGRVEERLLVHARRLDPAALRRRARRAIEAVVTDESAVDAHEDAVLATEERRALACSRMTFHDNADGTTTGRFTVPTLAASMLRKILDTLTAPRRGRLGATEAQAGGPRVDRDWAHERGLAFVSVLEHLPKDRLGGKVAATVVVTLDHEALVGRLRAAGVDTGELVSAGEARRLACGAAILPMVLGGASQPLDLGRAKRLFSEAQRVAAATRHSSCAADGCQVPYAWTEAHHRRPWSHGGATDLADLVPLCGFHHRRIHDAGFTHRHRRDGSVTFHRRT